MRYLYKLSVIKNQHRHIEIICCTCEARRLTMQLQFSRDYVHSRDTATSVSTLLGAVTTRPVHTTTNTQPPIIAIHSHHIVKKLHSLKPFVRTTVTTSHN